MDVGLHVVNFTLPGGASSIAPTLGAIAESAEAAGVKTLTVMDHFFQLEFAGGAERDMLEGYTTLGYLAAKTLRIQLGLLVTGVTYRYPGLLAKTLTTLDVLSEGRAQLGIGAAWYEREHDGLGVAFPPISERFERLEETLQICLQMWSEDDGPFQGKYYRLAETRNVPQNIQQPRPPIMIGGSGEKKTLRLVAKYADACNLFVDGNPENIRHKLEVLRGHCDREKRDYESIRKTVLYMRAQPKPESAHEFVEEMKLYAGLGIEQVMLMPMGGEPEKSVSELAPLVERLAAI